MIWKEHNKEINEFFGIVRINLGGTISVFSFWRSHWGDIGWGTPWQKLDLEGRSELRPLPTCQVLSAELHHVCHLDFLLGPSLRARVSGGSCKRRTARGQAASIPSITDPGEVCPHRTGMWGHPSKIHLFPYHITSSFLLEEGPTCSYSRGWGEAICSHQAPLIMGTALCRSTGGTLHCAL